MNTFTQFDTSKAIESLNALINFNTRLIHDSMEMAKTNAVAAQAWFSNAGKVTNVDELGTFMIDATFEAAERTKTGSQVLVTKPFDALRESYANIVKAGLTPKSLLASAEVSKAITQGQNHADTFIKQVHAGIEQFTEVVTAPLKASRKAKKA